MDTVKFAQVNYGGVEQSLGADRYNMFLLNAATDGSRALLVKDTVLGTTFSVRPRDLRHVEIDKNPSTSTPAYLFVADFTQYSPGPVTAAELLARFGITFTRASNASVQTSPSALVAMASNVARYGAPINKATSYFGFTGLETYGLVVEEARTTSVGAEDVGGAGWTAKDQDGYGQAQVFTDPAGNVHGNLVRINGTTAGSLGPSVSFNGSDVISAISFFAKDLSGGTAPLLIGVQKADASTSEILITPGEISTSEWTKYTVSFDAAEKYITAISNSFSPAVVFFSNIAIAKLNIEKSHSFSTEWVNPADVTRAIDKLSIASTSVIDSGAVGVDVEFTPKWFVPEATKKYYIWYISANYYAAIEQDSSTQWKLIVTINGTTRTSTVKVDPPGVLTNTYTSPIRLFIQAGAGLAVKAWMSTKTVVGTDWTAPALVMDEAAVAGSVTGATVYLFNDNSASSLNAWVRNVGFMKKGSFPSWVTDAS